MRGIRDFYRDMGLGSKVFLFFTAAILISNVILYLFSSLMFASNQEAKARQYNKDLIDQYIRSTDNYFLALDDIAHALMFNSTIQIALSSNRTQADLFRDRTYALDAISLFEFGRDEIKISIFSEKNPLQYYTVNSELASFYNSRQDEWYQEMSAAPENRLMVYGNRQLYLAARERKPVVSVSYRIWNIYSLDTIGYLLIDIEQNSLKELYDTPSTDINGLFIFSDDGRLVYQTNVLEDPEQLFARTKSENGSTFSFNYNGQVESVIYGVSNISGWTIVTVTSHEQLFEEIRQANTIFLAIYASLFIVASVIGYGFSKRLVRPLARLTEAMDQVKDGGGSAAIPPRLHARTNDEVGQLIRAFNNMTSRIETLVAKARTEELVRMESDFEALQQQINPHFLYNTLEMIIGMASLKEHENIILVCKSLADMFRYNLNGQRQVTLKEELKQVQNYLRILGLRFPNSFEVRYEIDEAILTEQAIKFILQPFVENAITHGFTRSNTRGLLRISIQRQGERLYFAVQDNGRGMEPKALDDLLATMKQENPVISQQSYVTGQYRGIINVYLRLLLTYGERMKFHIESKPNEGTLVEILVPPLNP